MVRKLSRRNSTTPWRCSAERKDRPMIFRPAPAFFPGPRIRDSGEPPLPTQNEPGKLRSCRAKGQSEPQCRDADHGSAREVIGIHQAVKPSVVCKGPISNSCVQALKSPPCAGARSKIMLDRQCSSFSGRLRGRDWEANEAADKAAWSTFR